MYLFDRSLNLKSLNNQMFAIQSKLFVPLKQHNLQTAKSITFIITFFIEILLFTALLFA